VSDEQGPSGEEMEIQLIDLGRFPTEEDPFVIREVRDHLRPFLGEPAWVLHDLLPIAVHLDIHLVAPSPERPWIGVFTTGMSAEPMPVPPDLRGQVPAHLELMLRLTPDYLGVPFEPDVHPYAPHAWPFRLLHQLARYPFVRGVHLGAGHGFRYDDEGPIECGVPFHAVVFDQPCVGETLIPPFRRLYGGDTQVLAVLPLHPAEARFHREKGYRALFEKLDPAGVTDLLDPARRSVI
jgi:hypothetical protein